jgi:diacylglycerol kinase family enzyme
LGDETTIRFSEYAGHSIQIVGEELENYDVFVAVGGDGTVSEIASALSGTGKKLAVYPTGSGNGFAREFGFNRNLNQLMKAIREQKSVACDVLSFNNQKSVNVSGIGFDSAVAVNFAHRKKRGFRNYVVSTLKNIRSFHPIQAVVKTDTEEISGEFFMLTVANTVSSETMPLFQPIKPYRRTV